MQNTRFLDRREFTAEAVLAMLSGVVILVSESACGGSGSSSPMSPAPLPTSGGTAEDKVGQISNNHGHSATVTAAEVLAENQVQLDIRGQADHTHSITLTHDDLKNIGAGTTVSTDSTTTNGHDHTVTFNPATSPGSGY